jgi:hypothetical protein
MNRLQSKANQRRAWTMKPLQRALRDRVSWVSEYLPVWVCGMALAQAALAAPLQINVIGVDPSGTQSSVTDYRWTVEEDVTKVSVPGRHATRNQYSFSFHSSYMPVVAAGKVVGGSSIVGPDCTDPNNPLACVDPDRAYMAPPNLDPTRRYYVSVLATDGYAMGGAAVAPGQTSVTVYVNKYPLPTAQLSVFVFNDNSPLNAAPDLPQEEGLAGFTIFLTEAGGTYGASGGQVTQDAFGNPLGTVYEYGADGQPVLDAGGAPIMVTRGTGIIMSGPDGVATIKNLFPAKYTIQVIPPAGSDWHQTTTIEGTKGDDAWIKNAEPSFFQEFGPPGHHVFTGFTQSGYIARNGNQPALNGATSVTGRVTNVHNSRPPNYTFYSGNPMPNCWVGLNEPGGGRAMYAAPCNPDSTFAIPNVPAGNWELVVWDEALDVIMATATITVPANAATYALGDVPVFSWFARYEGRVFYDSEGSGFPLDINGNPKPGIADQVNNIRFRDGSIYQSTLTKRDGSFAFPELFPFFNFMIAEVDYSRFKATGATVVVDAGGAVPPHNGWSTPSFGRLSPQTQTCTADDVAANVGSNPYLCTTPGQLMPYRVEQGVILLEGMQTFLGQTNHIEYGKKLYAGEENGGIAGIVHYGITRAEDDPRYGTAENWEPGVSRVQVNLFLDCDGDGKPDQPAAANDGTCAAGGLSGADAYAYDPPDVDNYPFCWRDPASCGLTAPQQGPEDRKRSRSGGTAFSYGDVFRWGADPDNGNAPYVGLSKTDGWDDALPTDCPVDSNGAYAIPYGSDAGVPLDCYDGLRAWNQVRPAVFDGGYAFGSVAGQSNLPNVKYVVEAVAPPGYIHQGNGDKNVVFGDSVVPTPQAPPYECVGMSLPVPQYLSLFPAAQEPNIMYRNTGQTWKKCDMKAVDMQPGRNPAPDFHLYTETPVAGHGVGFILDDLSSEFDINAPTFGEKHAPPWLPVSLRDWTGREISRVYADEFGSYNFLVPSTFTINPPFPSGVAPSMMVACMNSPGPIDRDPVTGAAYPQPRIDPFFNRQYSQFCYTLQYLPGKTTYLDTPVVPVAAFAGRSQNPLDCEFGDGTPVIYSVSAASNGKGGGPWVPANGSATQRTVTVVSLGKVDVVNPYYNPAVATSRPTIQRDYGFGAAAGSITLDGVPLTNVVWSDGVITAVVPGNASTGQLMVARNGGSGSPIGVTLTVGGSANSVKTVSPGSSIQSVIDSPLTGDGDLILVAPGTYNEYVIVDKRVRVQGWGAPSTVINAAKFSSAGLKNWRALINRKIDATPANPPVIDPDTGLNTINAGPLRTFDLLPGQTLGHSLSNNEPLLFGAEEGPGILLVGKQAANGPGDGHFNNQGGSHARVDGLTITGADAGGGILASGYVRALEISNNRIVSNYGTYGGGIRIGHTALLDATNADYGGYTDSQNGCAGNGDNCVGANIHHNWISQNGGAEAGAGGGVTLGNGASNYAVTDNAICGNFTMADGGGIGQLGLADGGNIARNTVIFNQTFNQSSNPTGGGIFIGGAASLDGSGLSPGTGYVTIAANLIQGNNAGAGAGGGIRLFQTNGRDVASAPNDRSRWNRITVENNMIVNNVAAYAGGGLSLQDALRVRVINNTIADNDSTATNQEALPAGTNTSAPQPAGVVSHATNSGLLAAMSANQAANNGYSNAALINNIIWHNRSFCWAITGPTPPNNFGLFDATAGGGCNTGSPAGSTPFYSDLAVIGVSGASLNSTFDIVSGEPDPRFVAAYFNGNAKPAPIIAGVTTLIDTAATADEGGNFIDIRYGPLTRWNCPVGSNGQPLDATQQNCPLYGDYHLQAGSPAINAGNNAGAPSDDFDGQPRARTTANPADIGADEFLAGSGGGGGGGGGGGATPPVLSGLDNFNRANAASLGSNWSQNSFAGLAAVMVNNQQALAVLNGAYSAIWNSSVFGAGQGAAFTFANTTTANAALILKATGGSGGSRANYVRVQYQTTGGGRVVVATTTNGTAVTPNFTQAGAALAATFASGDRLTAVVNASGRVDVWKNSAQIGSVQLPNNALWTSGGGQIGIQLASFGSRVDDFAGGTVP